MHLILPFAAPLPEEGRAAARALKRPALESLRKQLQETGRDDGDEWTLSPPHERIYARAVGWSGADGALPFAAQQAQVLGLDTGSQAWAMLTPVHWHLGTEQMSLLDPAQLMLDEAASRALMHAVQPLFSDEGWRLEWGRKDLWLAAHDSLAGLPTASLDRVIGRNVDAWLGSDKAARQLRRLQAEVQMLLHGHALNAERESRGLLAVNSVWISGCGAWQPIAAGAEVRVDDRLRAPALAGDWAAWCKAWDSLEEGPLAELLQRLRSGQPVQLSLCGERGSLTLGGPVRSSWQRWWQAWGQPELSAWMESL